MKAIKKKKPPPEERLPADESVTGAFGIKDVWNFVYINWIYYITASLKTIARLGSKYVYK